MKNTKQKSHGFKKLMTLFMSMLFILTLFPVQAFAFTAGTTVNSWVGGALVSADGGNYRYPTKWSYMDYHSDGTVTYGKRTINNTLYTSLMFEDGTGEAQRVYCIESGTPFTTSQNGYSSENGNNSLYFNLLPDTSREGIRIATLYGWQPGFSVPIEGVNEDDFYMATQIIIWEFQQQLRSDAHSLHDNGPVHATQFYQVISGRPAEKAYQYILDKIAAHGTVPSFTAKEEADSPVHELKWDTIDKVYRLTLTDTNQLNIDFKALSADPAVSITRNGNQYTITSTKMIIDPITFTYQKNSSTLENFLIWGNPGYQTMMSGTSDDPITFYMKIKTETYGWAKIIKASEDKIAEGISFTITGTDVLGQMVTQTVTTGADGTLTTELLPDTYLVTEVPVDRYVTPASQYVTIECGQTSEVHFTNVLKKFRVALTKTDQDTETVQGDATLAGAQYGLYKGNELIEVYTTDTNGAFLTNYYVCADDWTLREITPSTGYLLDETIHKVGAQAKQYDVEFNTTETLVTEKAIYGTVRLIKHTDDWDTNISENERPPEGLSDTTGKIERPESGAVFQIYLKSADSFEKAKETERDTLTTDEQGFALSKNLPYGYYTVHQVSAGAAGENKTLIPDFTVFVCHNDYTYSYILNNTAITSRIRVEKRDAETDKIISLAGTGFRIKDLDSGEHISQTIWYPNPLTIDLFYTSDEGYLMLPDSLPKNTNGYELSEVYAPFGYILDDTPIHFMVDGSENIVTITQTNSPQKATVTITKTGEVFARVEENNGLYLPIYQTMGLPGAVYEVIADEDIVTGDKTVRIPKDTVVETLTTGADATAISGELYLGKYRLEERTPPYGMVLNTEPIYLELTYAGQDIEINHTKTSLYDERQKVEIDLLKSIETDEKFDIEASQNYQSISFGLYATHDIVSLDGTFIPKDGLLEVVTLTKNDEGQWGSSFLSDLPFGSYYVKEKTTATGYVLNEQKFPVVFSYDKEKPALVSISVNDGEAIENKLIRGNIEGLKLGKTLEGGDFIALAGAKIGLFKHDVTEMNETTAILTTISAENGAFSFENVPFGQYIIKEFESPTGYKLSDELHHVYIGTHEQLLKITLENTLIRGRVQLSKTEVVDTSLSVSDKNNQSNPFVRRLPGAVFELYKDTNGDKVFDANDELLGELKETEVGLHERSNLYAGGYFIKEKTAPTGCILDEKAYYFEISENNQCVLIENKEAGQGFVNDVYRGNLKIEKNSSDGRKDGFAIEVKSVDGSYCETFTTGTTGIIEVTGLRVGKYTVTEISNRASQDYVIPDGATIEIKVGELTNVQFFNQKKEETKPSTPAGSSETKPIKSVPQTSDDSLLILWAGLFMLSFIALFACFLLSMKKENKGDFRNKQKACIAAFLSFVLLVSSITMIVREFSSYGRSRQIYDGLTQYVLPDRIEMQNIDDEGQEHEEYSFPNIDFETLRTVNPDIVGWVFSEDTRINYPIVQGDDNAYYLKHLFDNTANKSGSIYMDYENKDDFSNQNTILYGHNMRDGSMFSELLHYENQAYFEDHTQIFLITENENFVLEVFSAFVASPNEAGSDTSPWRLSFDTDEEYTQWLISLKTRSLIETNSAPSETDNVLTLSTCTNNGKNRFVIMGRLLPVE